MKNAIIENYFSVIIPLYNKRDYVVRAINSILAQSYTKYEIIVIDDGSTDGSLEEVESIKNSKIRVFHQSNAGVSVARNAGVRKSEHDYVVFLDADDVWLEGLLSELNILINRFPTAGIYGVNNYFEYANGKIIYENYNGLFNNKKIGIIKDYFGIFSKYGKSPFCNSGCCYPKHVFNEIGGYKAGVRLTEDSDLWCRIAFKYDIAYSAEPLITYHMETAGNTHHVFEPKDFEVSVTLNKALMSNSIKPNLVKSVKKLIAFQQLNLVKRAIISGYRLFAFKKLMNIDLFLNNPIKTTCLLLISLFPTKAVQTFKSLIVKR